MSNFEPSTPNLINPINQAEDGNLREFEANAPDALDQFVNQNFQAYTQIQIEKRVEAEQAEADKQDQAILDFKLKLENDLGRPLANALGLTYHIEANKRNSRDLRPYYIWATFQDGDSEFQIKPYTDRSSTRIDPVYKLYSCVGGEHSGYKPDYDVACGGGEDLRGHLAVGMGIVRVVRAKETSNRADQALKNALHDYDEKTRRQQQQADRMNQFIAETKEHERLSAIIDQKRQELIDSSFKWPAHHVFVYYQIGWCAGAVHVGEDSEELMIDMQTAWTLTDMLADDDYIEIYTAYGKKRSVKFDIDAHKPIWERFEAHSVEDLPLSLRESLHLRIDGISTMWVTEANTRYFYASPNNSLNETIGEYALPVAWVREALSI